MTHYDLIIKGGTCLLTSSDGAFEDKIVDIGIINNKITSVGDLANSSSDQIFEAKGLHVLPGLIDTQVHFRQPGFEKKETISSGTLGAVMGGITSVFEMPNTSPPTTSPERLNEKLELARNQAWSNYAFFVGASPENAELLGDLEKLPGCCGIKIFMGSSTGSLLLDQLKDLKKAVSHGNRRMAVHCEDNGRLTERTSFIEKGKVESHPIWRDEQTALEATQKIVRLAEEAQRPVHVLHVTTDLEMEFLAQHKGLISVECTPQHLTLSAPDCYERLGTLAQMNPPIRSQKHQDALWEGVRLGVVDIIGSDHAPHTLEEKQRVYPESPSGMPGVQTTVPVMLNHVSNGRLSLHRLVELMCVNPCKLYKIANKGFLKENYDADITIVDLNKSQKIQGDRIESLSGWTPFDQMEVKGWPVATVIQGQVVMKNGELVGEPVGQPVEFKYS